MTVEVTDESRVASGSREGRVLVTGHEGYIGTVLTPMLRMAGYEVVGLDAGYFTGCSFGIDSAAVPTLLLDVRDVQPSHLEGFEAVVHLAALSNDPVGELNPACTHEINYRATLRLARLAREAGVSRFLFSSSCSLYGASGDTLLDEDAPFNPVTAYGASKVAVERSLSRWANDGFSPTYLRNATAYGLSARLRTDLVVNNLTAAAWGTGEVLLRSDGSAWRPLVHVEDIARTVIAVLAAPRELVHDQAFNVGTTAENYRIREVADEVAAAIPGSRISFAGQVSADIRNYRVNCDKLADTLPEARGCWTVPMGIAQLRAAFASIGLKAEDVDGLRFVRMKRIRCLMSEGLLDGELRWRTPVPGRT
jgi:nucleoside-diphosphate-sugar epimerase